MTDPMLERLLVPVANETDAETTCDALKRHVPGDATLQFVHVIEKAGGAPDKAPLEARRQQADDVFDRVAASLSGTDYAVDTDLRYGTDVLAEITAAADAADATAIAFTPQPSGTLTSLLSGNTTKRLVTSSRRPVVVLPRSDEH